jgi:hypothetical protein
MGANRVVGSMPGGRHGGHGFVGYVEEVGGQGLVS